MSCICYSCDDGSSDGVSCCVLSCSGLHKLCWREVSNMQIFLFYLSSKKLASQSQHKKTLSQKKVLQYTNLDVFVFPCKTWKKNSPSLFRGIIGVMVWYRIGCYHSCHQSTSFPCCLEWGISALVRYVAFDVTAMMEDQRKLERSGEILYYSKKKLAYFKTAKVWRSFHLLFFVHACFTFLFLNQPFVFAFFFIFNSGLVPGSATTHHQRKGICFFSLNSFRCTMKWRWTGNNN